MTFKAKLIPVALFLFLFITFFISPVKAAEIVLSMPDCEIELGQSSCLSKPSKVLNPKEGSSYTLKYFGPGSNITIPRTAYYTPANNWTHNPTGGAGTQIQINYNTGVGSDRSTVRLYDMNDLVNYVYTARPKALCRSGLVWNKTNSRCEAGSATTTPTPTPTTNPGPTPAPTTPPMYISSYPANASQPQIRAYDAIVAIDLAITKLKNLISTTNDATLRASATKTLETSINNRAVVVGIYNQANYYEAAKLAGTVIEYIYWFLKEPVPTSSIITTATTPVATLAITPSNTVSYPTNVTYTLTSKNAKSCSVVGSDGITYVDKRLNFSNMIVTSLTAPGTITFTTQCWSGLNGTGVASAIDTDTITVTPSSSVVPDPTGTPVATFAITPSNTVSYPTNVTYTLTSKNAKSCSVVGSDGITYVDKRLNFSHMIVTSLTGPGTITFTTQCWSGLNGTGVASAIDTDTITVTSTETLSPIPVPNPVPAPNPVTTTTSDNYILSLINQLTAQVAALQQQLLALQQGLSPTVKTINLTQNLSRGSQGAEVTILQTALASLGYLDDENISGYFGTLTEEAVKKFQCDKNIICTGTVSTTGYGMVGPSTRTALIAAFGSGSGVTPINQIDPISPIVKAGPFKSFTATTKKSPNLAGFSEISLAWDASGSTYGGVRIKCSGTWTRGTEGGQPLVNATTVALGGLPPDTDTRVLTVQVANLTDGASLQEDKTFSLKGRAIFNVADGIFGGTHNCVAEVVSGGARVGSTASASFTVNSSVSTGGTPTGPAATGLSCFNKDLYENGSLKQVCPKAPNGGISCDVSLGGCAGEGYVWINGQKVKWAGNTSGSCFADSACEANHECKSSTKMCVTKTLETTENGVRYMQTWNETIKTWGSKTFVACDSGYHETSSGSKTCELSTRSCSISGGTGSQTYNITTKSWGSCTLNSCPTGQHKDGSSCVSSTRACEFKPTLTNGYGVQTWAGSWGDCERKCNDNYYLKSEVTNSSDFTFWTRVVGASSWGSSISTNNNQTCEYLPRTMDFTAKNVYNTFSGKWQLEVAASNAKNLNQCYVTVTTNNGVVKDGYNSVVSSGTKQWAIAYDDMELATVGGTVSAMCMSESWYGLLPKTFTTTYKAGN